MKTIKRTKDMPDWANWVAMDKNKCIYFYSAKPILGNIKQWLAVVKVHAINIKLYCKNWRKSLRKIADKPTRKELNKLENDFLNIESRLNSDILNLESKNNQLTNINAQLTKVLISMGGENEI